jgi:hypothetical protein
VDEAESIKRLVEDISNVKKWPNKITKSKGASKSGIIGYSYKDVSNKDND